MLLMRSRSMNVTRLPRLYQTPFASSQASSASMTEPSLKLILAEPPPLLVTLVEIGEAPTLLGGAVGEGTGVGDGVGEGSGEGSASSSTSGVEVSTGL